MKNTISNSVINEIGLTYKNKKRGKLMKDLRRYKFLYLLILPSILAFIIFKYAPLYGIQIAFKDYKFSKGIWGSEWVGFKYFIKMFSEDTFLLVLRNTFIISFGKILTAFPCAIIFAIILNEIKNIRFKKISQTISYLPHFLSWVVIAGVFKELLSYNGPVNGLVDLFGGQRTLFLIKQNYFVPIILLSNIWQTIGWGSIIYLAAIAGIDKQLYESADIDGAGRIKKIINITLPSLVPVMLILFLIRIGHVLNAGFNQIFNLYTPIVYDVADILDTYTYRVGLENMQFSYSTAIGLFKNAFGVSLMLFVNNLTKKVKKYGI